MFSNDEKSIIIPRMAGIKETAKIFGLPVHFVRCKVAGGEVVAVRAGRRFLVNVDKFAEYLNNSTIAASQTNDEAAKDSRVIPINLRR